MNKQNLSLFLGLLCICGMALTPISCGTPQRTLYTATAATQVTVDHAMEAWNEYVEAKHPPVSEERKVERAFIAYSHANNAAVDALQAWIIVGGTEGDAATAAKAAAAKAGAALAELLEMIQGFGLKL